MIGKLSPLQLARLRVAISALSEPRRSIYLLCARDELEFSEVARKLDLTVPEVRSIFLAALSELLAAIEEDGGGMLQ
jgi:DNA-directed RNA polymerase specialized sigma24 family protein